MDDEESYKRPNKVPKLENDDFVDISTTISAFDNSLNDSETCVICMEPWTTGGDHKIVSINCGHVFGQKCIESWLYSSHQSNCPTCKRNVNKKDIRPIFLNVKTVRFVDNDEYLRQVEENYVLQSNFKSISEENSQLKFMNKIISTENIKLTDQITRLEEMRKLDKFQLEKTQGNNSQSPKINFQLTHKLQISAISGCRVMAYSRFDNNICVSSPSSNRIVPGFGVRLVDIETAKIKKYISLHSMPIRDLEFNPFCSTNLMLSCSLDKSVKMISTNSDSIVSSFQCSSPVWCCTWSNHDNIIYAGLSDGSIDELDNRKSTSAIRKIYTSSNGPILSLNFASANDHVKKSGLIVTNSRGVVFLRNSSTEHPESLTNHKMDTLLISKRYQSSLVDTAFNNKSFHLFNTFRPSDSVANVRYILSSIDSMDDDSDTIYTFEINCLDGSNSMEFMSRSCFLSNNDESENLLVAANEETSSIKVWNLNNGYDSVRLFPKDVIKAKPVLDICQYNSDPISFAALNSDNLYLYKLMK